MVRGEDGGERADCGEGEDAARLDGGFVDAGDFVGEVRVGVGVWRVREEGLWGWDGGGAGEGEEESEECGKIHVGVVE